MPPSSSDAPFTTLVPSWYTEERGELATTRVFTLRKRFCRSPTQPERAGEFVYLDAPDWVNVIALTPRLEVVLIEQFRQGLQVVTLEIPGGQVDAGEAPLAAGLRELREETGYYGDNAQLIGKVSPNPALQNNWAHTLLVRDVTRVGDQELDGTEEIAVRCVPLARVPGLIQSGTIHHALVVAAFHHLSVTTGSG